MGEANDRGTFDERKAAAIKRNSLEREARIKMEDAEADRRYNNMTAEERESQKKAAHFFSTVLGISGVQLIRR